MSPRAGSCFSFTARFEQQNNVTCQTPALKMSNSISVLIVEDAEINRELLRVTLEKLGHSITEACNGQEAIELFKKSAYDIIFMDMQMPVLDRYDAVRQIRKIEKEQTLKRTPIVALTTYAMQGDREKCPAMPICPNRPGQPKSQPRFKIAAYRFKRLTQPRPLSLNCLPPTNHCRFLIGMSCWIASEVGKRCWGVSLICLPKMSPDTWSYSSRQSNAVMLNRRESRLTPSREQQPTSPLAVYGKPLPS
jgi:CheY-like chemotaxis protein